MKFLIENQDHKNEYGCDDVKIRFEITDSEKVCFEKIIEQRKIPNNVYLSEQDKDLLEFDSPCELHENYVTIPVYCTNTKHGKPVFDLSFLQYILNILKKENFINENEIKSIIPSIHNFASERFKINNKVKQETVIPSKFGEEMTNIYMTLNDIRYNMMLAGEKLTELRDYNNALDTHLLNVIPEALRYLEHIFSDESLANFKKGYRALIGWRDASEILDELIIKREKLLKQWHKGLLAINSASKKINKHNEGIQNSIDTIDKEYQKLLDPNFLKLLKDNFSKYYKPTGKFIVNGCNIFPDNPKQNPKNFWTRHKRKILAGIGIAVGTALATVIGIATAGIGLGAISAVGTVGAVAIGAGGLAGTGVIGAAVGAIIGKFKDKKTIDQWTNTPSVNNESFVANNGNLGSANTNGQKYTRTAGTHTYVVDELREAKSEAAVKNQNGAFNDEKDVKKDIEMNNFIETKAIVNDNNQPKINNSPQPFTYTNQTIFHNDSIKEQETTTETIDKEPILKVQN